MIIQEYPSGPVIITSVVSRGIKEDREELCDDRTRNWSDVTRIQEMLAIPRI